MLPRSDFLPQPFSWIKIPAGQVTLENRWDYKKTYIGKKGMSKRVDVANFAISKYPITNAQFAIFMESGGYKEPMYWTKTGWHYKQKENLRQPRYWTNHLFNGENQPVVGISWFEACAFSQWVSNVIGEYVHLPSETQWQRAAQGDDNRNYPWGDDWDRSKCQNSVGTRAKHTSSVSEFENRGDSPFGVVDMIGNIWEWCLTEYYTGLNEVDSTTVRVLRGGSWIDFIPDVFHVTRRMNHIPYDWSNEWGFRIVCSCPDKSL